MAEELSCDLKLLESILDKLPRAKDPDDIKRQDELFEKFDHNKTGQLFIYDVIKGCIDVLNLDKIMKDDLTPVIFRAFRRVLNPTDRAVCEDRFIQGRKNDQIGVDLLFENERMRIWTIEMTPGLYFAPHRHDRPYFYTCVSGGQSRMHVDGKVVDVVYPKGATKYFPDLSPENYFVHDLTNTGSSLLTFVTVEFNDGRKPVAIERNQLRLVLIYIYKYLQLKRVFCQFDKSNNQQMVTSEQFEKFVPELKKWGLSITNQAETFKGIDTEGVNSVSFREFVDWAYVKTTE